MKEEQWDILENLFRLVHKKVGIFPGTDLEDTFKKLKELDAEEEEKSEQMPEPEEIKDKEPKLTENATTATSN